MLITFPLKLIQNKFIAEGGGEGPCHKHVRRSQGNIRKLENSAQARGWSGWASGPNSPRPRYWGLPHFCCASIQCVRLQGGPWTFDLETSLAMVFQGGPATPRSTCLQDLFVLTRLVLPQADGGKPRLHWSQTRWTSLRPPCASGSEGNVPIIRTKFL